MPAPVRALGARGPDQEHRGDGNDLPEHEEGDEIAREHSAQRATGIDEPGDVLDACRAHAANRRCRAQSRSGRYSRTSGSAGRHAVVTSVRSKIRTLAVLAHGQPTGGARMPGQASASIHAGRTRPRSSGTSERAEDQDEAGGQLSDHSSPLAASGPCATAWRSAPRPRRRRSRRCRRSPRCARS